jgi:serine protease Do
MNSAPLTKTSASLKKTTAFVVLAAVSFLAGGQVMPHLQLRWVDSPAARAQAAPSSASLAAWARTEPVALAAEKGSSAVVSIDTVSTTRQRFGFFGEMTRLVPEKGAGSGFIFSPNGYVLTNSHVVEGANRITVTMADGKSFTGKLVGIDHLSDIAVVKLPGQGYPSIQLGDSSTLHPGEWAIAEGNPLGTFSHTVSLGVVSALARKLTIGDRTYEDLLQTDAAINPGNSGGLCRCELAPRQCCGPC